MRWLLLKDLQILRRSPLQAVLLVVYPVLIAILVGLAVSRGPEKPRVALLNEVPTNARVSLSGTKLPSANTTMAAIPPAANAILNLNRRSTLGTENAGAWSSCHDGSTAAYA